MTLQVLILFFFSVTGPVPNHLILYSPPSPAPFLTQYLPPILIELFFFPPKRGEIFPPASFAFTPPCVFLHRRSPSPPLRRLSVLPPLPFSSFCFMTALYLLEDVLFAATLRYPFFDAVNQFFSFLPDFLPFSESDPLKKGLSPLHSFFARRCFICI